jgi:hypothetical protein
MNEHATDVDQAEADEDILTYEATSASPLSLR